MINAHRSFHARSSDPLNPECGYCHNGTVTKLWHATDTNRRTAEREFLVVRCSACHLVQTIPQPAPDEMSQFYPGVYYPTASAADALRGFQLDKLRLVQRFHRSGRLLDVGAGIGLFVREASAAGFDAEGIEISRQAVEHGRTAFAVRLTAGDLLDAQLSPSSFAVVTLWHVLEHLRNPRAVLQTALRLLRPDGRLFVAVPNIESFQARCFRSRWYHLDVPRHLFHYSPGTLTKVLADCGFAVEAMIHRSREHNFAGILGSIMRLSIPDESIVHKSVRKLIAAPLATGLAAVESALTHGGTFIAVARPAQEG